MTLTSRPPDKPAQQVESAPQRERMAEAIEDFLDAAGLPSSVRAMLSATPGLVARAWADEFLDGYHVSPAQVLAERMPAPPSGGDELITICGIDFESVCPHHLLPYGGVADLAYLPGAQIVGFGQLARLVDCLAHRLTLQEELGHQIAQALCSELGARGAAVRLVARQSCLALRAGRHATSRVVTEAFDGLLAQDAELRRRWLTALAAGGVAHGAEREG